MALRNGPDTYGLVTRVFHWGMMALVAAMLALGMQIEDLEPGLANLWLYSLHKSLGFLVLGLVALRIGWHLYSPPPHPIGPQGAAYWAVRVAHWGFYLLLIAIPLTGWAGSSATGIDVMIADRWTMPMLVAASEDAEKRFFGAHGVLTKLLVGLILLHVAGAVKRALSGDGTIRRMIRGRV